MFTTRNCSSQTCKQIYRATRSDTSTYLTLVHLFMTGALFYNVICPYDLSINLLSTISLSLSPIVVST